MPRPRSSRQRSTLSWLARRRTPATQSWTSPVGSVVLHRGPRPRLEADGEVDAALVHATLLRAVADATRRGADVDVSGVTFLDARGLRLVVTALSGEHGEGRIQGTVPRSVRLVADAAGVPIDAPDARGTATTATDRRASGL